MSLLTGILPRRHDLRTTGVMSVTRQDGHNHSSMIHSASKATTSTQPRHSRNVAGPTRAMSQAEHEAERVEQDLAADSTMTP